MRIVVCVPVEIARVELGLSDAELKRLGGVCRDCGAAVVVADSTRSMGDEHEIRIMCSDCDNGTGAHVVAPETERELREKFGDDIADMLMERVRNAQAMQGGLLNHVECNVCGWWTEWVEPAQSEAAGVWHVYDEHRDLWNKTLGDRPPQNNRPCGVAVRTRSVRSAG